MATTYNPINMTFEEACTILDRGENLNAVLMYVNNSTPINVPMYISRSYTDEILLIPINDSSVYYEWTASGITKQSIA